MSEVFINIPDGSGSGGGVSDINGATGPTINILPGSGIDVTTVGNNITISNTGSFPTGTPFQVAGFDVSGALSEVPGFQFDANGQLQIFLSGTLPSDNINMLELTPSISSNLTGGFEGIILNPTLSGTMAFMSQYNAEADFQNGYLNTGGLGVYQDQNTSDAGSIIANYNSFAAYPTFNGTMGSVSSFTGAATVNVSVPNGLTTFNDFTHVTAGTGTYYQSAQFNPTLDVGTTYQNFIGFNTSPNLNGALTSGYIGIQVSPNGTGTVATAVGIQINLSNITNTEVSGPRGISSDSRTDINVATALLSGQNFQIINRHEGEFTVAPGSPVTGTDSICNDFAGDLFAQDNIANGPTGGLVGWTGVGFISEIVVATGKTVDTANMFLAAASLPDPGGGIITGGTVTNLSMMKTATPLPQGGTLNITNLYGFHLDDTLGSFSSAATNAWGLYITDPTLNNFIEGKLGIGNNVPTSRLDLPATTATAGSSSLKLASGVLMSTPENGAVESDGTNLYWTDDTGTRQTLNGGGGGTPGGSDQNIQFNNSGSFGGISSVNYDLSTDLLTLGLVATAPTTQAAANNFSVVSSTTSYVQLSATANRTSSSTVPIADGIANGQVITVRNASTHNLTLLASGNVNLNNVNLVLLPGEVASFEWDGAAWNPMTGANYSLSNLSPTAITQNLNPNTTNTRTIGDNSIARWSAISVNSVLDSSGFNSLDVQNHTLADNITGNTAITTASRRLIAPDGTTVMLDWSGSNILFGGGLIPTVNDTFNLGSQTNIWDEAFIDLLADASGNLVIDITNRAAFGAGSKSFQWDNTHLDLVGHAVINVLDPVNPQDAATKNYVDSTSANPFKFFASSQVTTADAGTSSGTFATTSNSPAFTFTPTVTGKYKVYFSMPFRAQSGSSAGQSRVLNTSGGATLLQESQGAIEGTTNAVVAGVLAQSVYTLTAATPYVFDIQTKATAGTVSIDGNVAPFYMFAERVG